MTAADLDADWEHFTFKQSVYYYPYDVSSDLHELNTDEIDAYKVKIGSDQIDIGDDITVHAKQRVWILRASMVTNVTTRGIIFDNGTSWLVNRVRLQTQDTSFRCECTRI